MKRLHWVYLVEQHRHEKEHVVLVPKSKVSCLAGPASPSTVDRTAHSNTADMVDKHGPSQISKAGREGRKKALEEGDEGGCGSAGAEMNKTKKTNESMYASWHNYIFYR